MMTEPTFGMVVQQSLLSSKKRACRKYPLDSFKFLQCWSIDLKQFLLSIYMKQEGHDSGFQLWDEFLKLIKD